MSSIRCVVVTPEATSIEEEASFVVVPLYDGEKGVAVGHSPMIGRLGYGELRLMNNGTATHYYVDGGFVQVESNVVTVLTERILKSSDLNASQLAEELREVSTKPAPTAEELELRDRAVLRAKAKLRVAERA